MATKKSESTKTHRAHGVDWPIQDGKIRILVNIEGRDCANIEAAGFEVDWTEVPTGRDWGTNASWVSVEPERFDAFMALCLEAWTDYEDVELYTSVEDLVLVGDGEIEYAVLNCSAWQVQTVWVSLGGIPRKMRDVKRSLRKALGAALVSVEGDPELTPKVTVRGLRMDEIEDRLASVTEGVYAEDPKWEG